MALHTNSDLMTIAQSFKSQSIRNTISPTRTESRFYCFTLRQLCVPILFPRLRASSSRFIADATSWCFLRTSAVVVRNKTTQWRSQSLPPSSSSFVGKGLVRIAVVV